jgi:hypothetical protein
MLPAGGIKIALVDPPAGNALQRLLVPRPLKQVEISWNGVTARFLVPCPAVTVEAIRRCLATSGFGPQMNADGRG